jgi:cell wall-associated NlpC family hydrolase
VSAFVCGALSALVLVMAGLFFVPYTQEPLQGPQEARSATQAGPREEWAADLLRRLGNDTPTHATIAYMEAWHRAEGGSASFNWLNTTQDAPGATDYNSVGVKNYPDYATGIEATAQTLTNGRYPRTLAGLVGNAPVVDDAEMGVWGTGGAAIRRQLEEASTNVRAKLVSYALSLVGIPYVRGGRSASGGDCSGTMQHVYLHVAGVDIGDTTFSQWPQLAVVEFDQLQPGDLWFGQFSDDQHVGLVADVGGDGRWDLVNNGGLQASLHVDYGFMDNPYFNQHTMGYRRAL